MPPAADVRRSGRPGAAHELVAAETRRRVAFSRTSAEPRRHLLQQLVAGLVPQRVVDDLEAIEIEEQPANGRRVRRACAIAWLQQLAEHQRLGSRSARRVSRGTGRVPRPPCGAVMSSTIETRTGAGRPSASDRDLSQPNWRAVVAQIALFAVSVSISPRAVVADRFRDAQISGCQPARTPVS